jgi:KDPG and KHG aldolase
MKKSEVRELIREVGIIPAIRVSSAEDAHFACDVVASGGIPIVEITMTVPEAVELIAHLVRHHEKMLVGAGTVLNTEMAGKCLDSGVHFLTSPEVLVGNTPDIDTKLHGVAAPDPGEIVGELNGLGLRDAIFVAVNRRVVAGVVAEIEDGKCPSGGMVGRVETC